MGTEAYLNRISTVFAHAEAGTGLVLLCIIKVAKTATSYNLGAAVLWCHTACVKAGTAATVISDGIISWLEYLRKMFIGAFDSQGGYSDSNGVSKHLNTQNPSCPTHINTVVGFFCLIGK